MENINVSTPNDGAGDKLRDAFVKVNSNFTEIDTQYARQADLNNKANIASPTFTWFVGIDAIATAGGIVQIGDVYIVSSTGLFKVRQV